MRKYFLLCFALLFLMFNQTFAQSVTKFAGTAKTTNGTFALSTTPIAKDVALFNQPFGIGMDKSSNIWISDRSNHCIRMIKSSDQMVYIRAGYSQGYKNATGVNAQFDNPMGLVVGPNNEIYVVDNGNNCIRKISAFVSIGSAQSVTLFAGSNTSSSGFADGSGSSALFNSPTDIAIDDAGNLYVADANNHAIRKITPAGVVSTIAGSPSKMGNLDGTTANAKFRLPTGIFVNATNDIYIADNGNQKIRKISGTTVTTVVTGLSLPDDVVVIGTDIYITDKHKIVKYSGSSSIFAGSTDINTSGYANGEGNAALFNNVKCMMYRSSDNSLYVADMDNHVIRNITLTSSLKPPKCSFTADKTTIAKTKSVTFTDQSTNTPTSRKWTFVGGSPSTSTLANPVVTYALPNTYNVKLVVTNADGTDSLTKNSYITVTNTNGINDADNSIIKVYPSPATDVIYLNPGNIDFGKASIIITSINGKFSEEIKNSLFQNDVVSIPVNHLQSGIYLLTIKTSDELYRFRFVKQ